MDKNHTQATRSTRSQWTYGLGFCEHSLVSCNSLGELIAWDLNLPRLADIARCSTDVATTNGYSVAGGVAADSFEKHWDHEHPKTLQVKLIGRHSNPIYDLVYEDSNLFSKLLFTGADEEIRIWRWPSNDIVDDNDYRRNIVAELRIPQIKGSRGSLSSVTEINSLASFDSGRRLVSAAGDGNAYVFDVETRILERQLSGHSDCLQAVVYVARTGLVATGSDDGTLKLWDLRDSNKNGCVSDVHIGDTVSALKVSDDDNWIAVGGAKHRKGHLSMCHISTREIISRHTWNQGDGRVQCLEYTDNNLVVGGSSRIIEYWNRSGAFHVLDVVSSSSSIFSLAYDKKGGSGILCASGNSPNINVFSDDKNHMMCLCGEILSDFDEESY